MHADEMAFRRSAPVAVSLSQCPCHCHCIPVVSCVHVALSLSGLPVVFLCRLSVMSSCPDNYDEFSARHHVLHVRSVLVSPPSFAAGGTMNNNVIINV